MKYFGLLIFIFGCSFQDSNPPSRLKIENASKIVIRELSLRGNDTTLIETLEEIYDSDRNLRESIRFFNSKNGLYIINQKVYLYDSLNNNIETIDCSLDDSFGTYDYDTTKYEYDKNENITLEITGHGGIHINKHFYVYDSLNRLVKDYIYRWGYDQFLIAYETLYKYDTTNKLIEKNEYSIFLNPKPELIENESYQYENNGNLIEYYLKKSSSSTPGDFVYNLSKKIRSDSNGNIKKEWYSLQTFDLGYSQYLPDTVLYDYNSDNKKISELRLFTSDLKNKQFNSNTQKKVFLSQFQTGNEYNKIEKEKFFYDDNLRLIRVEYYMGKEIDKLSLDKFKTLEYE